MLRPAKLFHSLHQLRHYVQTKVTELVVAQHAPPFLLPNPTTTTSPWVHQTKPLTNGLQRQFPMINKACFPLIGGGGSLATWRPLMAPAASTWHRGISLGINGGYHHGLGAFRSYSSATASPFFQAYHCATSSTQSTILSHLSSGIFAPLATNLPCTKTSRTTSPSLTCHHHLPQQYHEKNQSVQAMGASNKYNTKHLTNVSTKMASTIADENNNVITTTADNDMVTVAPTMLCTKDDLTTDMRSVTVPITQTCFYITLDLVPASVGSIVSQSTKKDTNTTHRFKSSVSLSSSSSLCIPWTKDVLPMLVEWKERQQYYYDQLLAWLQPCLDKGYRLQMVDDSSLRLYFPKQVRRRDQAVSWLEELKHIGDYDFLALVELQEETITVDEPLAPLGPDYFQGIHLFLTHIDDLVDHGPAFAQSCSV